MNSLSLHLLSFFPKGIMHNGERIIFESLPELADHDEGTLIESFLFVSARSASRVEYPAYSFYMLYCVSILNCIILYLLCYLLCCTCFHWFRYSSTGLWFIAVAHLHWISFFLGVTATCFPTYFVCIIIKVCKYHSPASDKYHSPSLPSVSVYLFTCYSTSALFCFPFPIMAWV